jgi:hypothetical protein
MLQPFQLIAIIKEMTLFDNLQSTCIITVVYKAQILYATANNANSTYHDLSQYFYPNFRLCGRNTSLNIYPLVFQQD